MNEMQMRIEKYKTDQWKTILAFIVIMHHWELAYHEYSFTTWLQYVGYLAVGGFFFISGYGLMASCRVGHTKEKVFRRYINILVPYLTGALIYGVLEWMNGEFVFKEYVLNLFSFSPSCPSGWYVLAIIIFYTFFYVAYIFFKGERIRIFIFVILMQVTYIFVLWKLNYGGTWYRSCLCFVAGIMFHILEEKYGTMLIKRRVLLGVALLLMFVISMICVIIPIEITGINLLACEVSSILFCIIGVWILVNTNKSNNILQKISIISYELYLIHGCLLDFGKKYISANTMLIILIPCSLMLAWILHHINNQIRKGIWDIRCKEKK